MTSNRIAVVVGTRPEIIKLAPVIHRLGKRALVVHTGQHFDANMSDTFLHQLHLGQPELHLEIGGDTRGAQLGQATIAIERFLLDQRPAVVVVQGDTNSGLAGALAANSTGTPLVHVEAGMRSYDRAMPEEHNRVLIDVLSDLCLVPHASNAGQSVWHRVYGVTCYARPRLLLPVMVNLYAALSRATRLASQPRCCSSSGRQLHVRSVGLLFDNLQSII